MSETFRRPFVPAGRAPAVRRIALSLPGAVLALVVLSTTPAHADPDAPPGAGRSGEAPAQTGSLPAPEHAAAHDAITRDSAPGEHPGPPGGVPQGPPAEVPADGPADGPADVPADVPAGPPAGVGSDGVPGAPAAEAAPGQKVVVCKYVRKPGAAEVFSHIIVVNENALLGKGFAGVFPFPFSDAHFKSVAVRYAAPGERASEISEAVCPAEVPGEEPPGEEPPGEGASGETGETGGIGDDAGPGVPGVGSSGSALPETGAADHLPALALLGGLGTLAGAWLVHRGRRVVVH